MTARRWTMAERVLMTLTGIDERDLRIRRNELRTFTKQLIEARGKSASSGMPQFIASRTDPEKICRWTNRDQTLSIDHTTYGTSSQLNLGSNGTLVLRIDSVRFDGPLQEITATDLIDAMIAGMSLVSECMDLDRDDPRIEAGTAGHDVALGWALTMRERRIRDGGDPNEDIDARCRTPWSDAECVSYAETDDDGIGRILPHAMKDEPRGTMLEIRHTALASVMRPATAMVGISQDPLANLRAVAAYRNSLT